MPRRPRNPRDPRSGLEELNNYTEARREAELRLQTEQLNSLEDRVNRALSERGGFRDSVSQIDIDIARSGDCNCPTCQEIIREQQAETLTNSVVEREPEPELPIRSNYTYSMPYPYNWSSGSFEPQSGRFIGLDRNTYRESNNLWTRIKEIVESCRANRNITKKQRAEKLIEAMTRYGVTLKAEIMRMCSSLNIRVLDYNDPLWEHLDRVGHEFVTDNEGSISVRLLPEILLDGYDIRTCACCERSVNFTSILEDGDEVCGTCSEIYYNRCEGCSNFIRHDNDDAYQFGDIRYCPTCVSDRFCECNGCGEMYPPHMLNSDDYCRDCRRSPESRGNIDGYGIFSYDYKPVPDYQTAMKNKKGELVYPSTRIDRQLFLGIELEHLRGENLNPADYLRMLGESPIASKAYYKNDGSLEGQGIELVTHPLMACGINWGEWRDHLKKLRKSKARAYDTGNISCGLHVHTSRSAYTTKYPQLKIGIFLSKCEGQFRSVSKRTNSFDRWSKIDNFSNTFIKDIVKHLLRTKVDLPCDNVSPNKYYAVNCNHNNTIEIRIFRGTLDYKGFKASVLFSVNFVNFINKISVTYLVNKTGKEIWDLFLSWMCPEGLKLLKATNRTGEKLKYKEESDEVDEIDWDDDVVDILEVSNDQYITSMNGNIIQVQQEPVWIREVPSPDLSGLRGLGQRMRQAFVEGSSDGGNPLDDPLAMSQALNMIDSTIGGGLNRFFNPEDDEDIPY